VTILTDGDQAHYNGCYFGSCRDADYRLLKGKADRDESINSEQNNDPYGCITRRIESELLKTTRERVEVGKEWEPATLDPLWNDPGHESNQVGNGHSRHVDTGGGSSTQSLTTHDNYCHSVATQSQYEYNRTNVDEHLIISAAAAWTATTVIPRDCPVT